MEQVRSSANYSIELDEENGIMAMRFIGNMSDSVYKEMWEESLKLSKENNVSRFIIDQTKIGNVGFTARAWVVINMFPRLKKTLKGNVHAAVLASDNAIHKSGVQFLAKAFAKLSGYAVDFFPSDEQSIEWLKKAQI